MPNRRPTSTTVAGLPAAGPGGGAPVAAAAGAIRSFELAAASRGALAVMLFAALTALAGQIRVPLPFTPVPLTLQTLAVLAAGAVIGPARGSASQFLLLAIGALGAPVFAGGGSGLAHISGPTGGYLLGFTAAALLVGVLLKGRAAPGFARILLAMSAGAAVIHALGVLHLTLYTGGSLVHAFELGSLPFLLGEGLKVFAAASIATAWRRSRGAGG